MATLPEPALAFAVSLMLLSPQVPMLFMGEEWRSKRPFPYFCDFDEDLNEAVREGRQEELSQMPGFDGEHVLDPTAEETFRSSVLDWEVASSESGSVWVERYRQMIGLRRERVVPLVSMMSKGGRHWVSEGVLRVEWPLDDGRVYLLVANPSDRYIRTQMQADVTDVLYALGEHRPDGVGAWSLVFGITAGH